ncbi:MAG: CRISPR-associated endonuclease Cas1 [Candidatus Kuenenia sp.]|nr:CRISPR-associated endonuclease Cas1 [Candidatus Kuenenia hertensis]
MRYIVQVVTKIGNAHINSSLKKLTDNLYHKLYDSRLLLESWNKIRKKGSMGGIDNVSIDEFERHLDTNIENLIRELKSETYIPEAYQEIKKRKKNTEFRFLGLPAIRDKIVQQAVLFIIEPLFLSTFFDISYAYRPGKGPLKAAHRVRHIIVNQKCKWVAPCDIDNFFDSIDQTILMEQLREQIHDEKLLSIISLWIKMGRVGPALDWKDSLKGIPQGAVVSPLLSNIYLHPLDAYMVNMNCGYVRYADNFVVLCAHKNAAQDALEVVKIFLGEKLKLQLNQGNRVQNVCEGFIFLGVTFQGQTLTVSDSKISEIRKGIENTITRSKDNLKGLADILQGLKRYYGQFLSEDILREIDMFIKGRLKEYFKERYQSGVLKTKREIINILQPVYFLSQEFTLYRGKVFKEIQAYCKREKRSEKIKKKPTGDPVQNKRKYYEILQTQSSVLMVNKAGTFLGINKNSVVVKEKGKKIHQSPINHLKTIILKSKGIGVSSHLIHTCADKGIDLEFLAYEKHVARIVPFREHRAELWIAQMESLHDHRGVHLARAFVKGKIKNQRSLILYFSKYHSKKDPAFAEMLRVGISCLDNLIKEVSHYTDISLDTLRGKLFSVEGRASSTYWNLVKTLLGDEISFVGRVRKGAEDLVNALLNYGYGILYGRVSQALMAEGLNQYIGYLHKTGNGRPVLVFDFIEEFRQQIVDRVVLGLLRKGAHLSVKDGVLSDETRNKLARKVLERIYTHENFRGKRIRGDEIMRYQAKNIVCYLTGKTKRYRSYIRKW